MRLLVLAVALLTVGAAPAAALIDSRHHDPLHDVRYESKASPDVPADVRASRSALLRDLGEQGVLSVDRATGAVRWLGRTDGYLTGPQAGTPKAVALRWLRANQDVLGLTGVDLKSLRLAHSYAAPNGVTRLIFQQRFRGIPAFDSTLRVNVARDGRIVNVGGRPRTGIRVGSIVPGLDAKQALNAAARGVEAETTPALEILQVAPGPRRATTFAGGHSARLTLVAMDERRTRLAWRVWFEESSVAAWSMLIDADTGAVIRRANQVKFAKGLAWDYYPGAPKGGDAREVDFAQWGTAPDRLRSNNTHVYNDADGTEECLGTHETGCVTDDNDPTQAHGDLVMPHEEIRPQGLTDGDWLYEYTPIPSPLGYCPEAGCAWNHLVNGSWLPNRDQDGTQVYFFVNRFHDHLAAPPISFTEAAGNFQFENPSGQGKGSDGIYASAMDAAAMAAGRPIPLLWSDNANMLTRPDGQAPRMQMFLFEPIVAPPVIDYPFSDVSGGSDATVVYHEYTHGLSNRLVIDAEGEGALNAIQSGSMGEAWSDFYAMDFLIKQGFLEDTDAPGEVKVGIFVDGGQDLVRTEAIDCRPGDPSGPCPRKRGVNPEGGGYTYEEFGRIIPGGAEVHADGEIWAQTLMDLRRRLVSDHGPEKGAERVENLVTRGMELSVDEPSFIDMRNAILQADVIAGKKDHRRIWEVFAARGMGVGASAVDGTDTAPVADFTLPPGLPAADMLAPAVTVDAPAENGVVRAEAAVFSGTAVDDAGITRLTVNGRPAKLDGSTWRVRMKLRAGRHTISVSASDIEDRTTTVVRTVRADVRRPRIARVRVRRHKGLLHVTGRVRDDVGGARVRIGRKRVRVSRSGRFFAAVRPAPVLKLRAVDHAGRVSRSVRVR